LNSTPEQLKISTTTDTAGSLTGFEQWFLDWVTPKPHRGRRHSFGSHVTEPARLKISMPAAAPPQLTATKAEPTEKKKGGRPLSEKVAEVKKFCYEQLAITKRKTAFKEAAKQFGMLAPKEERHDLRQRAR